MSRLLPLNALRAFETAARHLSFTRAADEMHVTQAAISHQVKALEARLGLKLFRRLPRGLRLTEEGQALLPELRGAFDRMSSALDRVAAGGLGGTLTVSTGTTLALTWLAPRLPRFQVAHPALEVRLMTSSRAVDFAREEVDLAIRHGRGGWPGLRADRLFEEPMTPLCGRAFKDRLRRPQDLKHLPLLRTGDDEEWPVWLRAAGVEGIDPTRATLFESTKVAVQATIDGLGVAVGSPYLFADDLAAGRLFQPFALIVSSGKGYWLVTPEAMAERPKIKAFREWIAAEAATSRTLAAV
jgi:DNA-binding transcriptional LysR family regulator